MLSLSNNKKCFWCWSSTEFDPDQAVLTVRGPWLEHYFVLCDERKIYATHDSEHGHCSCEIDASLDVFGIDQRTITYGGVTHYISEFSMLNDSQDWEQDIVDCVKMNHDLNPKLEFVWLAAMFAGTVPRIQFNLKSSALQRWIGLLFKMELVNNYQDYVQLNNEIILQWKLVEELLPELIAVLARRNLMEYLCGRVLSRVTQQEAFNDIPVHVQHVKDPLLKQTLGGGWCILGYIAMEIMNSKRALNLSDSSWVDVIGSTFNNWASLHRDTTDGTFNNTYYYYKDSHYSMTKDLQSQIYFSLKLSGPAIRSVLTHISLCDMNSRYKFSENYYHCQAEAYEPIYKPQEIISRLNLLYGKCTEELLTSYDIYCYCLIRDQHPNSKHHTDPDPNLNELAAALSDCLDIKSSQTYLPKLKMIINEALKLQSQLNYVSRSRDHTAVTKLSGQFRSLRMSHWSLELNNQLPPGSTLIITYHLIIDFLNTMSNVDRGYQRLVKSQYKFTTTTSKIQ